MSDLPWAVIDVYRVAGLTVAAQRTTIPGATLYRVTVDERHCLAAVFLVPRSGERIKGGQWRPSRSGKTIELGVPGGRLVVRRVADSHWGFDARFVPRPTKSR